MAVTKQEMIELNDFLESDNFEIEKFDEAYQSFQKRHSIKAELIDFEYYNEQRFEEAKKQTTICINSQKYEEASSHRDIRKKCQKHIEAKTKLQIEESNFRYEQDFLFYSYLGTAKNDKLIREYFIKEKQARQKEENK